MEFSAEEAAKRIAEDELAIDINLGQGDATAQIWTCDLTHEYVTINGAYGL